MMDDPQAGTQTRRIPQPKILEPGPRAQEVLNLDSSWTTTLPEDLLEEQATRLQLLYVVGVILWAMVNVVVRVGQEPPGVVFENRDIGAIVKSTS